MKGFEGQQWLGYHKISAHYGWGLSKLFDELKYDKVIILEGLYRLCVCKTLKKKKLQHKYTHTL